LLLACLLFLLPTEPLKGVLFHHLQFFEQLHWVFDLLQATELQHHVVIQADYTVCTNAPLGLAPQEHGNCIPVLRPYFVVLRLAQSLWQR
jgi:hypothetical protein